MCRKALDAGIVYSWKANFNVAFEFQVNPTRSLIQDYFEGYELNDKVRQITRMGHHVPCASLHAGAAFVPKLEVQLRRGRRKNARHGSMAGKDDHCAGDSQGQSNIENAMSIFV